MKKKMVSAEPTVVDLFAGAGGLLEGFRRHGFQIVSSVEANPCACETLKTRHAYWACKTSGRESEYWNYIQGKISRETFIKGVPENAVINEEIGKNTLNKVVRCIKKQMAQMGVSSIDVFIGGPPCQAYSLVGRARCPKGMSGDPRKQLYKFYVQLLEKFRPEVFVFENVPGILSANNGNLFKEVKKYFSNAGYVVEHQLLNAADYMVLENRKRVILVGWKKRLKLSYPTFQTATHEYVTAELFKDLPDLAPGQGSEVAKYAVENTSGYLVESGIRSSEPVLTHHITRPLNDNDREIYKEALTLWNAEGKRLNYAELPEKLKTHKNQESFLDRFKVVAADEAASHTVVAHIAKDGHYYIHPDIKQLRSISVREAARIQSFPDNYFFEGPRTAKLAQIGNAVPPLMAEAIAEKIKEMLQ